MQQIAGEQIERQDRVDNAVFELIQALNLTPTPVEWDIEMIGDVREEIRHWLVERLELCDEMSFYPYIEQQAPVRAPNLGHRPRD